MIRKLTRAFVRKINIKKIKGLLDIILASVLYTPSRFDVSKHKVLNKLNTSHNPTSPQM